MGRTMIDAGILKARLLSNVFKTATNEYYQSTAREIDYLAERQYLLHKCRECKFLINRKINEQGTLTGTCGTCRPGEIYGSKTACVRFEGRGER